MFCFARVIKDTTVSGSTAKHSVLETLSVGGIVVSTRDKFLLLEELHVSSGLDGV